MLILLSLAIFDGLQALIAPLALVGKISRASESIDDIVNSTVEIQGFGNLESGQGLIEAVNARAKWSEKTLTHKPISFTVLKDCPLLIKGESGIGKTSLALAIAGLINYEGSIRINGMEVRNIKREFLQQSMTVLLQDEQLFASSIRENLKIAKSDASDAELWQALARVELLELVQSLPEGLDTHIGAYGSNFSGGEKQRFRLARIFLRNTPLLILDEPFEHLQADQILRLQVELGKYCKGKTVLFISHQNVIQAQNVVGLKSD